MAEEGEAQAISEAQRSAGRQAPSVAGLVSFKSAEKEAGDGSTVLGACRAYTPLSPIRVRNIFRCAWR